MKTPPILAAALAVAVTAFAETPAPADAADGQAVALGQFAAVDGVHNPRPGAQWFPQAGLGLFVHWGLASVGEVGDLSWSMLANKRWRDGTTTPHDYYGFAQGWKPDKLDYDAMLRDAKAAGFTYAVMVTKHHDGFTFWPSEHGDLGTKKTFGGRDFVREFVTACRKHGLRVGLYYSPPDWWFNRRHMSFGMGGAKLDMDHRPVAEIPRADAQHEQAYDALIRGQLTELLTGYGRIDQIWFDGGSGRGMDNDAVRRLQPDIVVNRRNKGPADYGDSEGKLPAKRFKGWFEACVPVWPVRMWSYHRDYGQGDAAYALTQLVMLRAWGGNLLANLGPKGDGALPPEVATAWKDMAGWMAHSRESVIGAQAGPWPKLCDVPVTTRPGVAYLHFLPKLPERIAGLPADETTLTRYREVMPNLGEYKTAAVWKAAPRPRRATLLRTGAEVPFTHADGALRVELAEVLRTALPDVVKLEF